MTTPSESAACRYCDEPAVEGFCVCESCYRKEFEKFRERLALTVGPMFSLARQMIGAERDA